MSSPLSFGATQTFRKRLLIKNLKPYNDDGFSPTSSPGESELTIDDQSVIDSAEVEVIGEIQSENSYVKNLYGPEGGYGLPIDIEDVFSPGLITTPGKEPYYTFVASTYNAFSILTSNDPQGNNGPLSQDSALAKIAAESLQTEFEYRVAQETYQQTLGRVNAIDAVSDPYDLLAIATGNRSVIERDWKISVPKNIIGKGLDFISRISGVYSPYSWIPGDYFSDTPRQLFLNQAANAVTGTFDKRGVLKLPTEKTGMETFLDNTGGGQRSRLFKGLAVNRYRPDYNKNFLTDLFTEVPPQNYYVGSSQSDISKAVAPTDLLPTDPDGNKIESPVQGYSVVGKLYEGEDKNFKFGLNANSYYNNSGAIVGGFTWVSPKYKENAGTLVGKGNQQVGVTDADYGNIAAAFNASESTNYEFTKGSILDDTQRMINAADALNGDTKLQHVGNAIDQVSKVFNDGYKELTKGSRVINYVNNDSGQIEGREYCRVFTKDRPYLFMNELQKEDGMVNQNRKFTYSVLDNTYNLNIAPIRGDKSTNIKDGKVKKYMFSIENLSWRTSTKPGFTYQDLPHCERGPNGGRIMWFPPYDMNVSETNAANWTANEFLGRPEPIYTYNNTTRQGSLSWKIVVDHPSILNAIVDKELKGENSERVNAIVDSFFAGCRDYDIYELARRYPQFTYSDIYEIITKYPDPEVVKEVKKENIPTIEEPEQIEEVETYTKEIDISDYDFGIYFHNDIPGPSNATTTTANANYYDTFKNYTALTQTYIKEANTDQKQPVQTFFDGPIDDTLDNIKNLANKVKSALAKGAKFVQFELVGSASAPNPDPVNGDELAYNQALSKRRIDSFKQYFFTFEDDNGNKFSKLASEGKLKIIESPSGETITIDGTNCNEDLTGADKIYSTDAMKCRRVKIINVVEQPPDPEPEVIPDLEEIPPTTGNDETGEISGKPKNPPKPITSLQQREDVAKIIVKKLLTECDYFDLVREDSPMAYDGIKEKLKYFQPAFHAITPEGLNSRLTFLQQCIRPGDTIPVIGPDGKPLENDARNTSFGAPPICILRIGDFYHTKIAINQIGIQYEPLTFDLNPEGIGVQPMIANINMSFYFIGGQGLKEPVNRLQNALSFNYYANTEVYDERSIPTEDRSKINAEVWDAIESETEFGIRNRTTDEDIPGIGNTIGTELSATTNLVTLGTGTTETITGQTSFKEIINKFVTDSKNYVDVTTNAITTISNKYSLDGLIYLSDRNYTEGQTLGYFNGGFFTGNPQTINIFGKPYGLQDKIETLFNEALNDVQNDISPLLENFSKQNIKNSVKKKYKKRITDYINNKKNNYIVDYEKAITDIVNSELELCKTINKINFVMTNTDGYQGKGGKNILLNLTATTEVDTTSSLLVNNTYEEIEDDVIQVGGNLSVYYRDIFSGSSSLTEGKVYDSSYSFSFVEPDYSGNAPYIRFMHISFRDVLDNPNKFVEDLLGEDLYDVEKELTIYVKNLVSGTLRQIDYTIPELNDLPLILGTEGLTPQPQQTITVGKKGFINVYKALLTKSTNKLNKLKEKESVKKFVNYEPFTTEKERLFNYTKVPIQNNDPTKVKFFIDVYGNNNGDKNIFNGKQTFK